MTISISFPTTIPPRSKVSCQLTPKVLAIDPRGSEETRACLRSLVDSIFPPGRLPLSEIADGQTDVAGYATNCQIPGDSEVVLAFDFNLVAFESDLRMILRVKKI